MTTRVKICGLTNYEDAHVAMEAGADYLGFIFYPPSKRAITVAKARYVIGALLASYGDIERPPLLVGVFVNEKPEEVASILKACGLDLAQLSGDEPPLDIQAEDSPLSRRAYRAVRPVSREEAAALAKVHTPLPDTAAPTGPDLLLDTYHPTLRGGTGHVADWTMAAGLATESRLMLAGGLTPTNVASAIHQVRPFAVDVASGVEAAPGQKDHDAVRAFITAVRTANGR